MNNFYSNEDARIIQPPSRLSCQDASRYANLNLLRSVSISDLRSGQARPRSTSCEKVTAGGAESEPESESESAGVVATSNDSESESIKLRLRLRLPARLRLHELSLDSDSGTFFSNL